MIENLTKITNRIQEVIDIKNLTIKDLAKQLNIRESELIELLNTGEHLTLKMIIKLEHVLDAPILKITTKESIDFDKIRSKISFIKNELEKLEVEMTKDS